MPPPMNLVLAIFRRAGADLLRPRVLSLMFLPMLAALLLWGGLAWVFGAAWLAGLEGTLTGFELPAWLAGLSLGWLAGLLAHALLVLLLIPAVYVTALVITAVVFMPLLVNVVAQAHYPLLERQQGGTFMGSLANGLFALLIYGLVWVITLPLWLLGPFGLAISILLNAWLNQRLFIYDALAEHASPQELQRLRRAGGWPLFLLSGLLGLLHFVPVVNFVAPVFMALAFIHYALGQLAQDRNEGTP
jgi:CysZ protein